MTKAHWCKSIGIALIALALICAGGWYGWYRYLVPRQFRAAIEQRDYARAEQLWSQGVWCAADDPYAQFMLIKDRLQAVDKLRVTEWKIGTLQTINGTNRYFALVDLQDPDARFGIGLHWEGKKWLLKTDWSVIPAYVKRSIQLQGQMGGSN